MSKKAAIEEKKGYLPILEAHRTTLKGKATHAHIPDKQTGLDILFPPSNSFILGACYNG